MEPREYEMMYEVEDAHWWYRALHELILHFTAEERKQKGSLQILDAGCGTGRLCQLMSAYGTVTGCDISDIALELCSRRNISGVFKADLNIFDPGFEKYDLITSIDVLYHQAIQDDNAVIENLYRALKPGGMLILNLVAYNFLKSRHDRAVHTERRYTRRCVVSQLTSAGFVIEKATYRIGFLFLPIACYRLLLKYSVGQQADRRIRSDVKMPPKLLNDLLYQCNHIENFCIEKFSLPFGTSVFAVARKK